MDLSCVQRTVIRQKGQSEGFATPDLRDARALLDALPRNATGKLPRDVLEALARFHQSPAAQEGPSRAE